MLEQVAASFATTIVAAIQQEYPNDLRHRMDGPGDRPRPGEVHPAFYGCYDWHSAVEMHWALLRLMRLAPEQVPAEAGDVLDDHFAAANLATEATYFDSHPGFERPYGWGWALALAEELSNCADPRARRWARAIEPLAARVSAGWLDWLPRADYPLRNGMHTNSAFALARSLPWARRREPALLDAVGRAAHRWFAADTDYPAAWEPDGADFLSPALTEAELMAALLDDFPSWFRRFLPVVPPSLLNPVAVSDTSDGQIAHLHGLNLYRAHGLRVVATALGGDDQLTAAAGAHLAASIERVCGDDYMVEHWLAAYAVLAITGA